MKFGTSYFSGDFATLPAMFRPGIIVRIWNFLRLYLVALVLLGIFVWTVLEVYVLGVGPTPQQPPPGFVEQRLNTRLQWHRGNREESMTLEVAKDPGFKDKIVDRQASGTVHNLNNLEPGQTYYWRLIQGETPSRTYSFRTSEDAVAF
jgi:hypothetical protein